MSELVKKLGNGDHPVEVSLRPNSTIEEFHNCLDRGYVHIKFTATRGGTELGVTIDKNATKLSRTDFNTSNGTAHLVGDLTLDYVRVRCIADIDLETFRGIGHLEPQS